MHTSHVRKIVFTSWTQTIATTKSSLRSRKLWIIHMKFLSSGRIDGKFVFFFIYNKTSYVACTKVLYNYDRLWFNLQHLYTLNKNILKSKKKPYVQSLFIILWICLVCRKVTTPSFSNHSDLITSDVIIMTTQLINKNLRGIPERTITAPHVSCSGASWAHPCALLSFLTA